MNRKSLLAALLLLALAPAAAGSATIGLGVFGGASVPLVQDDNGSGSIFGLRAPVNLVPLITVEPYFAKTSGGDKDQDVGGITYTRSGIDDTAFGANVLLTFGTGYQFYPFVGVGSNHLKRDGLDATQTGYDFGLGLGFKVPVANLSVAIRGALNMVTDPGSTDTSRKWGEVTAGVSYGLLHFPPVP